MREDIFPTHRIVLAANFHAMFTDGMKESNQEVIDSKDTSERKIHLTFHHLKTVMDSIYTRDPNVNGENLKFT